MNTNSNNNTNNANVNNTNNNSRIEVAAQKMPILQLRDELRADGLKMTYVTFNDEKIGMLGYLNDRDRAAAEKALRKASEGCVSPFEAIMRLNALTAIDDSGIEPDEEVEVEGVPCYISYKDKTLYRACDCEPVCDLNDLNCDLPKEAVKTLLIERATR